MGGNEDGRRRTRAPLAARVVALCSVLVMVAGLAPGAPAAAESDGLWDYRSAAISGTYRPLVGQFAGDGATDILWYAPGPAPDRLWIGSEGGRGAGSFTTRALEIDGRYQPIVGDFAGDGYDDVLWYAPGRGADVLWVSVDDTSRLFADSRRTINGTYRPIVLRDYRGTQGETGKDRILWYAPGPRADALWRFAGTGSGGHQSFPQTVNGTYVPVVGDWNGDRLEDVLWYKAGRTLDPVWRSAGAGFTKGANVDVRGTYQPVTVYRSRADGVLWYASGPASDSYWHGVDGRFAKQPTEQLTSSGRAHSAGLGSALVQSPNGPEQGFTEGDVFPLSATHPIGAGRVPVIGDFDGDEFVDVLWYGAGRASDELWYTEPHGAAGSARSRPTDGGAPAVTKAQPPPRR